jgi:hypothetical protein
MAEVTATINRIVMDENYHVYFYNQFGYVAQVLETDVFIEISGNYLVCGGDGNSVRFFANTVTSIETPTLSQTYTPITAGFFQQGSQYFERLTELYDFINTNIVSVVIRDITALKFADGTTQTTAATGGGGSGTVTSVGFTEGAGIDITGTNPITTSGTVTITNTAPDQVVTLGEGTGIDVTGTYPNFTITNTAPDQTVVLNEGSGIDITGSYPNFTIASTVTSGIPHGTASGTDTYTTTITGVTAYNDADAYLIRFIIGNTTSATLNINSLGAIPLYRNNDGALIGGDIIDGAEMLCVYNSTTNRFQVIGTAPNTLLAYVTNDDSVAITKGQPVYAFGGQGDRLTVKRANNNTDATSAQTVGLVLSTSISVNGKGLIILNGQLDGLGLFHPSNGWQDGDAVYLGDTPGSVTRIKPHAPNHLVYLGFVTTANNGNAGRMYVRVQNGYEMDEIHDVYAQNPNNNDGLFFNTSNSLWESKSIATALGYTPGQGTVTSVAALTLGTTGTDLSSSVADSTTTPVITLNVPTASATNRGALSAADWSKFNGKQNVITLTTTGTSGPATFSGDTLNIPQYSGGSSVSKSFLLGNHGASTVATGVTSYGGFVKNLLTTAAQAFNVRTVMPQACTLRNWSVYVGAQPATGSLVFTMRLDLVDTAYTITVAAGSAVGVYQNTSGSLSVPAQGILEYKITNNAATSSGAIVAVSVTAEIS